MASTRTAVVLVEKGEITVIVRETVPSLVCVLIVDEHLALTQSVGHIRHDDHGLRICAKSICVSVRAGKSLNSGRENPFTHQTPSVQH